MIGKIITEDSVIDAITACLTRRGPKLVEDMKLYLESKDGWLAGIADAIEAVKDIPDLEG